MAETTNTGSPKAEMPPTPTTAATGQPKEFRPRDLFESILKYSTEYVTQDFRSAIEDLKEHRKNEEKLLGLKRKSPRNEIEILEWQCRSCETQETVLALTLRPALHAHIQNLLSHRYTAKPADHDLLLQLMAHKEVIEFYLQQLQADHQSKSKSIVHLQDNVWYRKPLKLFKSY